MAKTFEHVNITKARTEYVCKKCGKKIAAGEKNESHFGKGEDGNMFNYRLCEKCMTKK